MKTAYDQLTAITDGRDAVLEIRVSALAALIDSSTLDAYTRQHMIDQAVQQLRRRSIVLEQGTNHDLH